jgi:L-amino acid N-acyltransferase
MTASALSIRDVTEADIPTITSIYRHAVLNTVATLDTEEPTVESQTRWFAHHDARHPVLVAEQGGQVVGWASISEWSPKAGYRTTAAASVYVAPEHHDLGIGTLLLQELIGRARTIGLHVIIARISTTNEKSIRPVERCGFAHAGTMRQVGCKFGAWVDIATLQLILGDAAR